MADGALINLADRRPSAHYTIHVSHHWDGSVQTWVEGVPEDERAAHSVVQALDLAIDGVCERFNVPRPTPATAPPGGP